uniref:Uncharacterized protein n=1 Tax=Parascaris univalens TaxID=6257 RepID=A0A914ZP25_PARUN
MKDASPAITPPDAQAPLKVGGQEIETRPAVDYYTQYARANARSTVLLESGVSVRSVHGSGSPALDSYDGRAANAPIEIVMFVLPK